MHTPIALTAISFALFPFSVWSFGTIQIDTILHQHREHEHITRAALACSKDPAGYQEKDCFEPKSISQLAGSSPLNQPTGSSQDRDYGSVGSPDVLLPQGLIFDDGEHCDQADFLDFDFVPDYPRERKDATNALERCFNHMRDQLIAGISGAKDIVNEKGQISDYNTNINLIDCKFAYTPGVVNRFLGRGKCNAIQGFGYALHSAQDFYAHSNYGDARNEGENISIDNPPGLGNTKVPEFLDLRTWKPLKLTAYISRWLSTGCFSLLSPITCHNRITHGTMNKDEGTITDTGLTSSPLTDRGKKPERQTPNNFDRAVKLAIEETRRQWKDFQHRLRGEYGVTRGNLMICAITKDKPKESCQGRYLAIVVDSSGSNEITDPENLRITAAKEFNSNLVSKSSVSDEDGVPDQVTVIDFDDTARVVSPLGDPSQASFSGIDSSGGTCIACGIRLAIDELTSKSQGPIAGRAGILVLTDGEDPDPAGISKEVERAKSLGIRVSQGLLSPKTTSLSSLFRRTIDSSASPAGRDMVKRAVDSTFLSLILQTGGTFGVIDSAEAQKNFVDLVLGNGATDLDNAGGAGVALLPGLTVSKLISNTSGQIRFTYKTAVGERLNFTITPQSNQIVNSTLHDITNWGYLGTNLTSKPVVFSYESSEVTELEVLVSTSALSEGVISVGLSSSLPLTNARNGTTGNSTSSATPSISTGLVGPYGNTSFPGSNSTRVTTM